MDFSQFEVGVNKTRSMKVVRLTLQETGTYNQQHLRPFHTTVDEQAINTLAERFAANPNKLQVNAHELSDVAGVILRPSTNTAGEAFIPNGFGNKRLRFTLHVQAEYISGGTVNIFVFGYTDHPGVSLMSGTNIDPNMIFYVSSVIQTRQQFAMTQAGRVGYWAPVSSDHIHTGQHSSDEFQRNAQKQYLMRPVDVYYTNEIPYALEEAQFGNTNNVHDTRNTLVGRALTSRRDNSLPSSFAANVIQAQLQAIPLAANSTAKSDMQGTAAGFVQENMAQANPFLKAISNQRGEYRMGKEFSFQNLQELDPGTFANTVYITPQGSMSQQHIAGQTAYWHDTDLPATTATMLAHAVPAIMMSLGITQASFTSTNNTYGGKPVSLPLSGNSITGGPIQPLMAQFISKLDSELISAVTHNNALGYTIKMDVDVFGETWITIQIADKPEYVYVAPSFCDSLFAPTLTNNLADVQHMAHDFGAIVDSLKSAMGSADNFSFEGTSF